MVPRRGSTGAAEARALERARDIPNTRTATDGDALKRAFVDHLQYSQGADEHSATALDRYFAVAYSVRDRMMRRWIQTQQALLPAGREAGLLPLARVPHGPGAREQPPEPRAVRADAGGAEGPRARPRRPPRAGARRRARQRRPRPARGLLPRLAGDARAIPATATASATSSASSTRRSATATRSSSPTSGSASATRGRSRARRASSRSRSTAGPSTAPTSAGGCGCAGWTRATCSACPTTCRSPASATTR